MAFSIIAGLVFCPAFILSIGLFTARQSYPCVANPAVDATGPPSRKHRLLLARPGAGCHALKMKLPATMIDVLVAILLLQFNTRADEGTGKTAPVTFNDHVKPILRQHCLKCHGNDEQEAGLNLQAYAALMRGASSGPVVVAGRASQSVLFRAITNPDADARMPPNSPALPDDKVAVLRKWINTGLRETASSKSLAAERDLTFHPTAGSGTRPLGEPAMPTNLAEVKGSWGIRPLPVVAMDTSPWAPVTAAAGQDHVRLLNTTTKGELGRLSFPEGIPNVIRFSRDGSILMVAGGRPVERGLAVLFDVATGNRLAEIGDETDAVLAADLSPDQALLALGGSGRTVKVYSTTDGKLRYKLSKHTDWVTAIAFSPDGSRLVSGDRAGAIHLWDAESGGIQLNFREHKAAVRSVDWRNDSKLLASAGADGKIVWWDVEDGFPAVTRLNAHPPSQKPGSYGRPANGILSCRFGPQGQLVTTGRDRTVRIWDASGDLKQSFSLNKGTPVCGVFTHDGQQVISGGSDGQIRFWNVK